MLRQMGSANAQVSGWRKAVTLETRASMKLTMTFIGASHASKLSFSTNFWQTSKARGWDPQQLTLSISKIAYSMQWGGFV